MNKNETIIRTRGYEVTLPTAAVAAFLALSHDDQCELADVINTTFGEPELNYDDIETSEDTGSPTDLLIESMAQELDIQDQAIDAFVAERTQLSAILALKRYEITALVDSSNGLYTHAQQLDQAVDGFMVEREELIAETEAMVDILAQSARYVGQVRELLSKLGVEVKTDNTNGQPILVIDGERLIASAMVVGELAAA